MAVIKPFLSIRPKEAVAHRVAALPYDVYTRKEATSEVLREPLSFLKVDRAETGLPDEVDTYDSRVYDRAKILLQEMMDDGTYLTEDKASYYVYELIMGGRSQTGLVGCASIDDYLNGVIKKHENTREEKEIDRIKHVDILDAQTGPIFLAYRTEERISRIINAVKRDQPIYSFVAVDGVAHNVWRISRDENITEIKEAFEKIDSIYIADGHHRAASAVKVGLKRRKDNPNYTGIEEYNYFLSVLFPNDQLMILPYNRTVKDLNGLKEKEFLKRVGESFEVSLLGSDPYIPEEKAVFGMYLSGNWYKLRAKDNIKNQEHLVAALDVSILQNYLLSPILGIEDPRTDKRIGFVGGIRGLGALEKRVNEDMKVAFSMYPTSINELFEVSDAGMLMPPKSTWFEPKLRSGLFIHKLS